MTVKISRDNTGNSTIVQLGNLTIWFSYETPIAYDVRNSDHGTVVSENKWSTTTDQHLNNVDGGSPIAKKARLPRLEFEQALQAELAVRGL